MPILLDPDHAPSLDDLLTATDTTGLEWRLSAAAGRTLPRIQGLGTLSSAGATEISFLANPRYQSQLPATQAGAVIVSPDVEEALAAAADAPGFVRVVCKNPYLLYARVAQWFERARRPAAAASVHPSAVVAADAAIGENVRIGPHCVVEAGAHIGDNTVLGPACVIGAGSRIGPDSLLHARVTLYAGVTVGARAILHSGCVLGADGFGFAPDPAQGGRGAWGKIPQFGGVSIGDDVEIGANTTIDRGALEDTVIGNGVKLDNQIMVAHNVRIGAFTAVAACVGIAGSTTIGERCTIGGASMLSGHLTLGDDVHISGGTPITSNISRPGRYTGVYPYAEHGEWQRNAAVIQQLGQIRRRLRDLEKK
ncbi:UDP-3-O-(3-hydroxymyristoyl)glucosamine N-acyltransferase [Bordetella genomosp. 10]|uniref:UDP-3-O-acylglucosamine N-acyltransferase n=1 Tax=Bordetella genomosp. 10 TaxID=1416804 RepID=A0A261SC42_9BORD|nr:UDP-3-O-(3-hydroxymyristoyl)glucosamine N-acyltransferase [Bordetella genomosp. 10]OZI34978.1 UDP-3-O-(3-hydroxymyristoyl)glucosamine N-acyltransferase [Bordetella genomosp. 10]